MQINITNGTLTQIQETLTASSGYTLPTTISVSGATSNYNSTTGAITLTNLTQTMSITASGETSGINNIWLGTTKLAKAFVGNSEIASMWLGNVKMYEKGSPTPSGYTIYNNNFNWQYNQRAFGAGGEFKFKINSMPTDDNDYDYFIKDRGEYLQPMIHQRVGSSFAGVENIPTIENVEAIYYWGQRIQGLSINGNTIIPQSAQLNIAYNNANVYTLDSDITSIILTLEIYD